MRHNGGRRPDEILAEIDRTRGEMDRTLSAIEHRLTPGQLVDQGLDYLRHSGVTEFVGNLGGAAKHNPLPVALTTIGIAWLMALGRQPAQHQGSGASWFEGSGPGVSERMSEAKQQLSEKMGSVRESASGSMSAMSDTAREQWQRARGGVDYLVHEQPLVLGAIGLALGALLGGVAPRTRKEEELMGDASRNLIDKTKDTARQAAEAVKSELQPKSEGQSQAAVAQQTRKEPQSSGQAAPPAQPSGPRPPRPGTP